MLETSDIVHGSAMWSLSLVMSECSLSGRGQGHGSNFYIVDFEYFATTSRRYTGDIHNSTSSVCIWHLRQWEPSRSRHGWVHIVYHALLRLSLQLHTIDLVRTCRVSSFCTVAWQLARFQLTRRIARSLGDSGASCFHIGLSLASLGLEPSLSKYKCGSNLTRELNEHAWPRTSGVLWAYYRKLWIVCLPSLK